MAKGKKKQDSDEDMDLDEQLLAVTNKKSSSSSKRKDKDNSSDESDDHKDRSKKKKSKTSSSSSSSSRKSSSSKKKEVEESDSDSDDEVFNDGYDEDLYENEEDRIKLESMTQLEREDIIAMRYERRKQLRERYEQRKATKQREKKDKEKSSSSSSSRSSTSTRSTSRADKTDQALKDMMKKRDKARSKDEEKERERERERESRRDAEKRENREKEREREREREREQREKEKDREREKEIEREIHKQISTLDIQTLNQVRLSRNMLIKWVDQPYFEKLTPGFLVRVVIGQHMNSPVYRIGQILGIKNGSKLYRVENKETDKILVLTYAGVSKEFLIDNVSNNTITPAEHEKWITDMVRAHQKLPTIESIQKKIGDIQKAADYIYTDEDIEKRAQEKAKYGKIPVNIAFAKAKLIMERDSLEPNTEEWNSINERIEEYNRIQADIKQRKQDEDIMLKINKKNKDFNFQQQQSQTITDTVSNEFDPFARRKTRANAVVAGVLSAPISPQPVVAAPSSTEKDSKTNNNNNTPTKKQQLQEQTLQQIHQSIDLSIHIPDNLSKVQPLKKKRPLKLNHRDMLNNSSNMMNDRYQKNAMTVDEYILMAKK